MWDARNPQAQHYLIPPPQCDGMVERFNRTLKSALRKHAVNFGNTYLPGIVYAYRNSPHDSTGEKPSFLLFGFDCQSPSEAALMEPEVLQPTDVSDYCEQLVLSLTSARDLATQSIRKAQNQYKSQYDKKSTKQTYQVGDWLSSLLKNQARTGNSLSLPKWLLTLNKKDKDINTGGSCSVVLVVSPLVYLIMEAIAA